MQVRAYGNSVNSLGEVVASYEQSEFDSPLRSTALLLEYWRDWASTLRHFRRYLGVELRDASLEFEFAVCPVRGKGKPFYTDLAITTPSALIAIEAKYLEPPYDSCDQWLGENPSSNKKEVLRGWLELIGCKTGRSIDVSEVLALPYQLIHRTASACSLPSHEPTVIYHIFEPAKADYYSKALSDLSSCVGSNVNLALLASRFEPDAHYQELILRFKRGERRLSAAVIEAIHGGPIGKFHDEKVMAFG